MKLVPYVLMMRLSATATEAQILEAVASLIEIHTETKTNESSTSVVSYDSEFDDLLDTHPSSMMNFAKNYLLENTPAEDISALITWVVSEGCD